MAQIIKMMALAAIRRGRNLCRALVSNEAPFARRSAVFEVLVLSEAVVCLLLLAATLQAASDVPQAPELDLGQRAWVAARFSMAEADALGPLFKHLVAASRHGLRLAHQMQERIRDERERRSSGPFRPLTSLWQRRRVYRSAELAELALVVEQLEHMGVAIARYRRGPGLLMEVVVPMNCLRSVERHAET